MSRTFQSILIANRGEIACRVMRTAKAMGLRTIAVYSDADKDAPHVNLADQAIHIGPSPVNESYLVAEKIINAAKQSGAEAIHPGYGFLSENAAFASACAKAGLVFIGPKTDAIELMGDKAKAKRRMIKAGVPCVPGYQGEAQDDATLIKESAKIGFPIMVKAAAGGGGRGMRLVTDAKALPDAIKDARSEALNAFGDDVLILERAVQQPRHVEIQVFADQAGNTIHLGERDCSVQRRHQKVLEEAPCPVMTDDLRAAMGAAAVKAAKDIGYVGAGTVEFMLDSAGEFYFLEMNTRLQVEHPVTELVTGLDLVRLQIQVARGEALGLTQDDIRLTGHAIEARLYAEDPSNDFLPATGHLDLFAPVSGPNIRVDSGVETGSDISPFYDPMIAKIMAYGDTREAARLSLISALKDTRLFGVTTNQAFLIDALSHTDFAQGKATTAFIGENFPAEILAQPAPSEPEVIIGALALYKSAQMAALQNSLPIPDELLGWASATKIATPYQFEDTRVTVTPLSETEFAVQIDAAEHRVQVTAFDNDYIDIAFSGDHMRAAYTLSSDADISLSIDGRAQHLQNSNALYHSTDAAGGAGLITAPMHGALIEVFAKAGDSVTSGQRLAVLEAMKMQHEILADIDGELSGVSVTAGTQIAADTLMFEIKGPDALKGADA